MTTQDFAAPDSRSPSPSLSPPFSELHGTGPSKSAVETLPESAEMAPRRPNAGDWTPAAIPAGGSPEPEGRRAAEGLKAFQLS